MSGGDALWVSGLKDIDGGDGNRKAAQNLDRSLERGGAWNRGYGAEGRADSAPERNSHRAGVAGTLVS